jgi:DNA polymerase (family 10)
VPHRVGYDLDYERLFAAAAASGTILEIDGSPSHLDLNGPLARLAVHVGATLSIDSDSHRTDVLHRQMELGLILARRGRVEPKNVVNTRPLHEVRAFIDAKRIRG